MAVVTGGANGIGRGIVQALLEEGAHVVIADVEQPVLEEAVAELSALGEVTGVPTDVSDYSSVEALAAQVFDRYGACHLLFNNAGVTSGGGGRPWEQEPNDWKWCFSVNVFGVANGMLAFVPRMIDSGEPGVVVNTSSGDGGHRPGALRLGVRVEQGGGLLPDRGPGPSAARRRIQASRPAIFYPSGGLLDTGLWTAQRNRPASLARQRPRPPAPGTTFEEFREQLRAAGRNAEVMDLSSSGASSWAASRRARSSSATISTRSAGPAPRPCRRHRQGRAAAAGGDLTMTDERYTVISSDGHAGADLLDYKPYLAVALARRLRRLGGRLPQPVRRSPRPDRLPQLGQRSPPRRDRGRRDRRRGAVPQHRAAVLRGGQPGRPAAHRRRVRAPLGRAAGPQPLARRVLRARRRAAGRASCRSSSTAIEDARRRDPVGAAPTSTCSAGRSSRPSRPTRTSARCGTPTTSRCGRCARSSTCPLNIHCGSGIPDYGDLEPARAIMLVELPWFAHRPVWHLIFGGVLERHPALRLALTEQGVAWLPRGIETLDWFYARMTHGGERRGGTSSARWRRG